MTDRTKTFLDYANLDEERLNKLAAIVMDSRVAKKYENDDDIFILHDNHEQKALFAEIERRNQISKPGL